jgi:formate hydrogenlyase transcriptional activator
MKARESLQNNQSTATENELRRAVDTTPAFIHTARPDGYIDYFNRGWLDFFGKSLEDVCGWRWTETIHPDDVAAIVQKWHAALASGEPFEIETRVRRADGSYRALLHRKLPLRDEQGNIVKWFGSSVDIEDRKRAEEQFRRSTQELQRSEFYLAEGQRLAQMGSWAFDAAGFDYWSPELFRIYGLEPTSTAPTIQEYLDCIHPDDREFMANLIERILADASPFDATKRIVRPDGEVRYIRCVGAPVVENQQLKKYVGSALDVTGHELLTQELQRREAYLAEAQRLSHTGSFGWNLATGELVWSDENFRIFGYDPTVKPTLDLALKRIHPEDLSFVERMMEKAKSGTDLELEHRLLMPDGQVKHVHVIAHPLTNESGELEYVATVMDVTERKRAFEEIKALRDELQRENVVLREELGKTSMFEEVIGTSSVLQMVLARAAKVAPTDSTVLIMGETGTGKELIARAIHKRSKRSERPFISVNCAAVPSSLIMSELFGHEKGAFTGALQRRLGRFELAEGGTLFLDEVGDLPLETQIALLRVLQEREFERVGGTEVLRADVRVISATNRDLQAAIAAGAFRSDLYYRLNVFPIKLPPLRDRKEDVPLLVNYFVDRYAKRAGKKIKHIQKKALDALQEYSWPGNVRELQNVIERSLIIGETTEFSIDKSWVANEPQSPGSAPTDRKSNERQRIEAALAQSNGKIAGVSGAAAKLGIPASTLESKIRSLRINKFQFKGV